MESSCSPFFLHMITLQADTSAQIIRLTLAEMIPLLPAFTHYMMSLEHEENSTAGNSKYQIPSILLENQRITELLISTEDLMLAGRYRYIVYGQNSASNLDPNDPSIVGICEIGWILMLDNTTYYQIPDIVITNDIIYG